MKVDPSTEVEALAHHLRLCIQARRLTMRSVEDQLGMGVGYLGQLLRGNLDLKVKHVMAVLAVIGMEPAEFFSSLYEGTLPVAAAPSHRAPAGPPRFDLDRLRTLRPGEIVPGVSAARLDRAVRESLLRLGYAPEQESAEEERESPPGRTRSKKGR